ncbi:TPA: conserved phage C-terminal domain-containing protein [Staphylococcus aureus]|uniref:conserved phage C-terminal domain-containing protein n=2 Tax=Staphylococcus aureus TaxID=1280 RepID=UPI000DE40F21|nr:conserved phage C-terminal domain-containing protein [Staphylococcus aureus]MCS5345154.1 conserved phage C-terminal domain-containing protein [Staphylococcus aureus]MCS5430889.1 conserved phage C-terminal domain-containing protein [Staphylococcus aureus]MDG6489523.1 conserved phage C-terminal domain-containing protein [Staphylococcus aureus]MST36308.1 alpha/beta hydrolase [Staphylococcus aureus]NDQ55331.1 alpha/beta hydrolase [Staphylococcus aureus]
MTDQPSYYSIITANVRYDNRLTDSEKLLFAEITSLSNKYGYCTASNGYFAKLYEVTKVTVSRRIANLKECGYLYVEIIRNGNEIKQRKLYPLTEMIRPINTNDNTPINNSVNTPIITNVKENNTSINNTSNNNINRIDILSGNPTRIPYKEIIDYLNEKTGKKFSHKSKANQKLIQARFNEDNSKEDFFTVIDNMTAQWKGNPKMDEYLRPKTLFSGNFDNYKNQTAKINNESNQYIDAFQRASQSSIENLPF